MISHVRHQWVNGLQRSLQQYNASGADLYRTAVLLLPFGWHCGWHMNSPALDEVVFQNVQATHHLGEDENPVATSLQFWQQLVNQN